MHRAGSTESRENEKSLTTFTHPRFCATQHILPNAHHSNQSLKAVSQKGAYFGPLGADKFIFISLGFDEPIPSHRKMIMNGEDDYE